MNPAAFTGGGSNAVCKYQGSACGQCWQLTGPAGTAKIQVTDCCAGYPGHASCLNSKDPLCDWCAGNDHLHFDLDMDSFNKVCGAAGVHAGNCAISSAVSIACPAHAVGDSSSQDMNTGSSASSATPAWATALLVLAGIMTVTLIVVIVLLFTKKAGVEQV